jgi:hypothetical protein
MAPPDKMVCTNYTGCGEKAQGRVPERLLGAEAEKKVAKR